MYFKASLDIFSKITTAAVAGLLLILIVFQIVPFTQINYWSIGLSGSLYLALFLVTYGFHTTGYEITDTELIIKRPFKNKIYDRSSIAQVVPIENSVLRKSIRTFGVGGVFGYWGKFANVKYGVTTWYATRRKDAVLVAFTTNHKIVLTPNDSSGFVTYLSKK